MSEDKRLDEVIRVKKSPNSFVTMDKSFLEDSRLSYKAKGILAYLLSKPDNWKVIVGNLVNYSADGKASVYAGLKELKECGYYEKVPIRNERGTRIIRWESTIYENPSLSSSLFTENQEVEKRDVKGKKSTENSAFSLLPNFQEIENLEIENQFIENRERNNNYYNKNNSSNNHVTSCQKDIQKTLCLIYQNIDYAGLKIAHAEDMDLVDEFVGIILDVLLSQSKTIRINGESKPRELVKRNLLKLNYFDIEQVLNQFKKQGERIKKTRQYILSMLYHSPMELNAHYTNLVQSGLKKEELD
ncbi:MAG: DUF6017 domain-containing protein [Candidatus Fimousia sp.]